MRAPSELVNVFVSPATAMDLEKMLKRIKMGNVTRKPTLKTLQELCMAFVTNITFENLDMFGGKCKLWDLPTIYDNIVIKNRGGFCCDINGLLQWVLQEFGYGVELLRCYVFEGGRLVDQSDHMAIIVTLGNGEKWLADVGFGSTSLALPLKFEIGLEQSQPNGVFRLGKIGEKVTLEKRKQVCLKAEDLDIPESCKSMEVLAVLDDKKRLEEWKTLFGFSVTPWELKDFQGDFDYAQDENEHLKTFAMAVLQDENSKKVLNNGVFYEKQYVDPDTIKLIRCKECNLDDVYEILDKEFGIKLDFELKIKIQK